MGPEHSDQRAQVLEALTGNQHVKMSEMDGGKGRVEGEGLGL